MAAPLTPVSAAELNTKSPSKSIEFNKPLTPSGIRTSILVEDVTSAERTFSPRSKQLLGTPSDGDPNEPEQLKPTKVRSPAIRHTPSKPSPLDSGPPVPAQETLFRDNGGLTKATEAIAEDDTLNYQYREDTMTTIGVESVSGEMDDTAFSAFSAVPNADMTLFARSFQAHSRPSNSPTRQLRTEFRTPRGSPDKDFRCEVASNGDDTARQSHRREHTPSPSTSPYGGPGSERNSDNTDLILDFTEQFDALAAPARNEPHKPMDKPERISPTKSQTQPSLALHFAANRAGSPLKRALPPATPSKRGNLATLLDFDIPPAPTPRSVPSISIREIETLKSSYLSQISSLKASLSGREAEVKSLMDAVGDAERRVGEAQEVIREEQGAKEAIQEDRDSWERRGKEVEAILRGFRDEIIRSEQEKTDLVTKLEGAEKRCEEADTRATQAESRIAGMDAALASKSDGPSNGSHKEVEIAVEKVARELHALYKSKHETKVGALKKSYEARWEKRVKDLEKKLQEAQVEIEEMKVARDATMTDVIPTTSNARGRDGTDLTDVEFALNAEEHSAKIVGLTEELVSVKQENDNLIQDLERERAEKGDLVAAVEEMLMMSATAAPGEASSQIEPECLRSATSRASGRSMTPSLLAGYGRAESRIAPATGSTVPNRLKNRSISSGIPGKSGIISNIERMGKVRGE